MESSSKTFVRRDETDAVTERAEEKESFVSEVTWGLVQVQVQVPATTHPRICLFGAHVDPD